MSVSLRSPFIMHGAIMKRTQKLASLMPEFSTSFGCDNCQCGNCQH